MLSILGLADGCSLEGHFCVVCFIITAGQMTQGFILKYKISGFIFFSLELRVIHWKVENGDNPIHFGQPSK